MFWRFLASSRGFSSVNHHVAAVMRYALNYHTKEYGPFIGRGHLCQPFPAGMSFGRRIWEIKWLPDSSHCCSLLGKNQLTYGVCPLAGSSPRVFRHRVWAGGHQNNHGHAGEKPSRLSKTSRKVNSLWICTLFKSLKASAAPNIDEYIGSCSECYLERQVRRPCVVNEMWRASMLSSRTHCRCSCWCCCCCFALPVFCKSCVLHIPIQRCVNVIFLL